MKKLFFLFFVLPFLALAGEVSVSSVEARQRAPLNGFVDVVVTLQGSVEDVANVGCSFVAINSATKDAIPVEHIKLNGNDVEDDGGWTRKFIWDAKADVGSVKIDDVALTVEVKPLGGVQLWESGPYWAECNVGATKPEEYGYYFWWGDAVGCKRNASNNGWISVKDSTSFSFSSGNCPTYGMDNSQLQSAGYIDATGNLVVAHDAATAHLGAPWRMPTSAEFAALINNCDTEWIARNGEAGRLFRGRGAYALKSIFLPVAGKADGSSRLDCGSAGYYWSSTPHSGNSDDARCLDFVSGYFDLDYTCRSFGLSVRPVRGFASVTAAIGGVTTHFALDYSVRVKNVKAQQRYPWNGLVDITVTIQGTAEDVANVGCSFVAINSATKDAIPVEHIKLNGNDVEDDGGWTRKFIWDAKADIGAVRIDDVALTVALKSLGGVQLWENGPYWAECNVGANLPEECGYCFWWGDTVGCKRNASNSGWESVKDGSSYRFDACPTDGKSIEQLKSAGYIDVTGNLVAAHDAATERLGAPWRMPTDAEFSALESNCTTTWTMRNGVYGQLVRGKGAYASKMLFLPAAGYGNDSNLINLGTYGYYWSSTPYSGSSYRERILFFGSAGFDRYYDDRYVGLSVRPVRGFDNAAGTALSGVGLTANLTLDCREGSRIVSADGEELRYDANWYENADSVRITKNGVVVETGTCGIYYWQFEPNCTTRHVFRLEALAGNQIVTNETAEFGGFDHMGVITKPAVEPTSSQPGMTAEIRCSHCSEVLQVAEEIPALGYIRNVTARQLWPHKKVEVCYEVAEDIDEATEEGDELVLTCGVSNVLELAFTSDSSYPWTMDSGTHKGSGPSHKSGGYHVNNAKSTMSCTVSDATQVSFCWKVSSESGYDMLKFYVDGMEKTEAISGNVDWTPVTVSLDSSSSHTLKWSYEKDGSVNSNSDCGWVDCIEVKYAERTITANTVLGDTSRAPGLHRVVWDMEADDVSAEMNDAEFVVRYGEMRPPVVVPTVKNGTWTSKVATPSAWVANENNALRGITPDFSGSRYDESGSVSSSDPLSRLSDGTINAKGALCDNTVGIVSGTLTWILSKPIDLKMLRINTHWVDGGRDGINLNFVQIQKSGSSTWDTLANSQLSYGMNSRFSGSDLECVFTCSEDDVLAVNVAAIRFDLGLQDNSGSGFTEFEAVGGTAQSESSITIAEAKGVSVPTEINTSSSVCDGMTISQPMTLGYSPIDADKVELQVDGTTVAQSATSGEWVWTPLSLGAHTLKHIAGTSVWTRTVDVVAFAPPSPPNPPTDADANVAISQTEHSFTAAGGTYSIPVQGVGGYDGAYAVSVSDPSWITIKSAEVNWRAGRPLVYGVSSNDGVEQRVGYVYISGYVHTITQAGAGAELGADAADVEADGGAVSVVVSVGAGVKWDVRPNVDWLSVSSASGTGEGSVTITVAPWSEVTARSGTVTIAGRMFTVNQMGLRLKLDKREAEADWQGGVVNVTVTAPDGVEWCVGAKPSWVSIVGEDRATGNGKVVLSISENPSYLGRSGVVEIGEATLDVSQDGRPTAALSFGVGSSQVSASAKGESGSFSVTATPDLPWTATSGADWLTIAPDSCSGAGNENVSYTVAPNLTMTKREGIITITPEAQSGLAAKTLRVVQSAATSRIAETEHVFSAQNESFGVVVSVDENVGWAVTGDADWIDFGGTAMRYGPGEVVIVVDANRSFESREATIIIAGHAFKVTQQGSEIPLEYDSVDFDEAGGEGSVEVYADDGVAWTAVPSDWNWISIWGDDNCDYDANGNILGCGAGTVYYYISELDGGVLRTGWIQIGGKRVNITQKPYKLSIAPQSSNVDDAAGEGEFDVFARAGDAWSAVAKVPWITIVSGGTGNGNGTVRFRYTENDTGVVRTGKILVADEEYTLVQAPIPPPRIITHYKEIVGFVGEELVNPDSGKKYLDVDLADIDSCLGEWGEEAECEVRGLPSGLYIDRNSKMNGWGAAWCPTWERYHPLCGTPTAAGTYTVTISATWADGVQQSVAISVCIREKGTVKYTISFDANGGDSTPSAITCDEGAEYGELPTVTRTGYAFDGWYTAASGGTKVTATTKATGDVTLYAHWVSSPSSAGNVSVISVTAQQRYPVDGLVDIAVTIQGTAEDVSACECLFAATNGATKASIPVMHITRNGDDTCSGNVWTRKFIWDAKTDVGAVKIDDVTLTVGAKVLGGVKLWDNGPCWAECNVGATKPEECGYYFWWGDTVGYKRNANNDGWISAKDSTGFLFSSGNCSTYGKIDSQLQSAGYIDATGNLVAAHDAATAHLGAPWRMPTDAEISALINNCTTTWTTRNGMAGQLVTGKGTYASKSIFLPAAGRGSDSILVNNGSLGNYWSSTLSSYGSVFAYYLNFYSGYFDRSDYYRNHGRPVRPVRDFANPRVDIGGVTTRFSFDCDEVSVSFNAQGGSPTPLAITLYEGSEYGELPMMTRTGYAFDGWYTAITGGTKVTATTKATESATLYAHWTAVPAGTAFDYVDNWDGTITLMRYTGSSVPEHLVIPSEYDGKKVTGVGLLQLRTQEEWDKYDGMSFFGENEEESIVIGSKLKSVKLSEGIETIGNNSPFGYQSGIMSVEFPSTLKNIGDWAFCCCRGLKAADLSSTVLEKCLWSSFAGCTSLTDVKFPSTLTTLGGISFAWCRALKSVTFMGNAPTIQGTASDGGDGAKWGDWAGRIYVDSGFDFKSFDTQRTNPKYLTGIVTYVKPGSTGWGTVPGNWQGNSIVYMKEDSIPELPPSASADEVRVALEGSADAKLQENITDATVYGQYREWAMKIGAETVKGAANSWISFAVDSAALLEKVPVDSDLKIEEFKSAAAEGAFDFTVSVKDVAVGSGATDANLKKVFGLGGTTQLGTEEFDPDKVALEFGTPVNGKLKFTASPKDKTAKSFFMKMKVR